VGDRELGCPHDVGVRDPCRLHDARAEGVAARACVRGRPRRDDRRALRPARRDPEVCRRARRPSDRGAPPPRPRPADPSADGRRARRASARGGARRAGDRGGRRGALGAARRAALRGRRPALARVARPTGRGPQRLAPLGEPARVAAHGAAHEAADARRRRRRRYRAGLAVEAALPRLRHDPPRGALRRGGAHRRAATATRSGHRSERSGGAGRGDQAGQAPDGADDRSRGGREDRAPVPGRGAARARVRPRP
jgi:hypothetical protein